MDIGDAQRDVRRAFQGGFVGQLVSSVLWGTSAALATWGTPRSAILALVLGGVLIFPVTVLVLRATGRSARLDPRNPMDSLGRQVAFTLPIGLPVAGGAALHHLGWFYPAVMILLGAHYLPFAFLYGMRMFGALGVILAATGLLIGLYVPNPFGLGAWFTAVTLALFAFLGRSLVRREERAAAG